MENNARRSFLKKATLAGGAALLGSATSWASTSADAAEETTGPTGKPVKTSDGHTVLQVLQTLYRLLQLVTPQLPHFLVLLQLQVLVLTSQLLEQV